MPFRPILLAVAALLVLGPVAVAQDAPVHLTPLEQARTIPAGTYKLDPEHASLLFRVDHLGFSMYTARFTRFGATAELDPARPEASKLVAEVEVASLQTDNPNKTYDFNAIVTGKDLLDAASHPKMVFKSTRIEMTGPTSANIVGDLTLRGITKPVVLAATFNGGYGSMQYDPSGSRIGFSARGKLNRSEFGITAGVPPAGTKFGVSDQVDIIIEAEFTRPKG